MMKKLKPEVLESLKKNGINFDYKQEPDGLAYDIELSDLLEECDGEYYNGYARIDNGIKEGKGVLVYKNG